VLEKVSAASKIAAQTSGTKVVRIIRATIAHADALIDRRDDERAGAD
jgi:hypothetical protein